MTTDADAGPAPAPEPLMTIDDLAAYLKMSPDWVRGHAAELGGMKVGRSWRFDHAGVERYLNRRRTADPLAPTPLSAARWEAKRTP